MNNLNNNIRITSERLSNAEIKKLLKGINKSPGFNNFTQKELLQYNKNKSMLSLRSTTKLFGITATRSINKKWMEFAVFYVFKKFRKRGYGKSLWRTTIEAMSDKDIFLVTSNSRVKKLALQYGFTQKSFFGLPFSVIKHFIIQRSKIRKIRGFLKKLIRKQVRIGNFAYFIHTNKKQ